MGHIYRYFTTFFQQNPISEKCKHTPSASDLVSSLTSCHIDSTSFQNNPVKRNPLEQMYLLYPSSMPYWPLSLSFTQLDISRRKPRLLKNAT